MKTTQILTLIAVASFSTVFMSSCQKEPVACISPSSTQVETGQTVDFRNCSTEGYDFKWTAFDGQTSTNLNYSYRFTTPGQRNFTLEAYSKNGKKTDVATVTITVVASNAKALGSYNGSENCSAAGAYTYTSPMVITANGNNDVFISNFADWGISVSGTVNGNTLDIPYQITSDGSGDWEVYATGTISGNTIYLSYSISYTDYVDPNLDFTDSCTATLVR